MTRETMMNVDLRGRLSLPISVGSSSRESRLHHLLDQTISSRRSFSREVLPRLPSRRASTLHHNLPATLHITDAKSIPNLCRESDAPNPTHSRRAGRGALAAPTSVSCPGGLSDMAAGAGVSYRARVDVRLRADPRTPRHRGPVVVSLEKLPPVIGEESVSDQSSEPRDNNSAVLPRVGGERALTRLENMSLAKAHIERRRATRPDADNRKQRPAGDADDLPVKSRNQGRRSDPRMHHASADDVRAVVLPVDEDKPRRKRKTSRGLVRQATTGQLPVGNSPQLRPARRGTVPASSKPQEWYIPRFLHEGEALGLFRRSVRKVSLVLSWFKSLSKKNDSVDQTLKSFLDMAKDLEESTSMQDIEERSGLTFDPKQYCAKKEVQLSEEARSILTTPAKRRTVDMIQKILPILQNQKAFAEYPLHMQQKFAQVAWFQVVPPKRVILKQGHIAENFYFILTGKAIVKLITKDGNGDLCMRAVARMQSGQSFGEVALLHQSVRTATVESATEMHILVITREDFQRIFFNTLDGQDPEHISFCKNQITFLRDFPIDLSTSIPGTCLFHFFRPGAVVVADSKNNEWIYIVRSGSCQILKRLDAVDARRPWAERKLDLRIKLPRNGTAEPGPRIDTRLRIDGFPHREKPASGSDDDLSSCDEEYQQFEDEKEAEHEKEAEAEIEAEDRVRVTRFTLPARPLTCADVEKPMPPIREHPATPGDEDRENRKRKTAPKSAPTPAKWINLQGPGFSKSKLFFLPEIKKAYIDKEADTPVMPASWAYLDDEEDDRLTLADAMTIDARSTRSVRTIKRPEPPLNPPCFVQLKRLRPRDAFGLEMVKFDDDQAFDASANTSVTLVSNGCELIMLSRRFFERHATEVSKRYIREKVRPFPADDTLQHNLQVEVNWDLYRKDIVGDFLDFLHQRSELCVSR